MCSTVSRIALAILIVMAVAACATMQFQNAGSPNTLEQDKYDCSVIMNQSAWAQAYARDPLGNMGYLFIARRDMRDCLIRKGWKEVEAVETNATQPMNEETPYARHSDGQAQ